MEYIKRYGQRSFSSLSIRNYRLYFVGQSISLSGTWLQSVAQTWLVLKLTHSGTLLGALVAVQTLPILLFGSYGGLVADRFNKRKLLYCTQSAAMTLAFIMALLVATHTVQVWMVFVMAALLGTVNLVDNPTRQTFVMEMVGGESLTNAISLNSVLVNLARVIGPLIAAFLIASVGLGWCFFVNGLSYIAVLNCLRLMDPTKLFTHHPVKQKAGQLREGFRYVWHTPVLRNTLIMMAIVGALTYEFQVVLPLFATRSFHGDASTYGLMMAAMGIGSLAGGIFTAGRGKPSSSRLLATTVGFGVTMLLTALMPDKALALLTLVFVGFASIGFNAMTNSTLQLNSSPEMRGRVMSLWTVCFLGSTPIGGPIIGFISEKSSPRVGLAVGGVAALVAWFFGLSVVRNRRKAAEQGAITEAIDPEKIS